VDKRLHSGKTFLGFPYKKFVRIDRRADRAKRAAAADTGPPPPATDQLDPKAAPDQHPSTTTPGVKQAGNSAKLDVGVIAALGGSPLVPSVAPPASLANGHY